MLPDLQIVLAFAFLILARLAYVAGTGYMLLQQERQQAYTRRYGIAEGFARFKRASTMLMVFDTVGFIVLNLLSIDTMHPPGPRWAQIAIGLAISIFGLGIKTWATRVLGPRAYYWYNFFEPAEPVQWVPRGPYKYLSNPMYGAGYLQTYGFALMCASLYGVIAAVFMQVSIFVFNAMVETPHFEALARQSKGGASS